jgi:hypothetical protein
MMIYNDFYEILKHTSEDMPHEDAIELLDFMKEYLSFDDILDIADESVCPSVLFTAIREYYAEMGGGHA